MAVERFATGKTLGESGEDMDRMGLMASAVTSAFYGDDNGAHARYAAVGAMKQKSSRKGKGSGAR